MALPKAVQAIGDAAEQAAVDAGMNVPGRQPSEVGGNPGPAAPAAAPKPTAAPAAPAAVPDPDPDARYAQLDKQFRNYKTTTDQTIFELRQQRSTDQAAIADLQSQLAQAKAATVKTVPAADPNTNPEAFEAGLKAWLAQFPQETVDEYEPSYWRDQYRIKLSTIPGMQSADYDRLADIEAKAEQAVQYQQKTQFQMYLDAMDAAFPGDAWIKLAERPEWDAFCLQQAGPYSQETYGDVVGRAKGHDSTTLIKVLKDFQRHLTTLNAGAQPGSNPALEGLLTPEGGAGGGGDPIEEKNAMVRTFTRSEVNQFFKDVATTHKYTPEQARSIESQIIAAQGANKIIEG